MRYRDGYDLAEITTSSPEGDMKWEATQRGLPLQLPSVPQNGEPTKSQHEVS